MRRRLIALFGVLALAVAACGGGDDDSSGQGDDTETTDEDDGSSRRTTRSGDDGDGGGDLEAYCELAAEADALEAALADEPSPDELEEYFDEQRALLDGALDVVPDEIADELAEVTDGIEAVRDAVADADFDITDEALAAELETIGEEFADASDVIDEFEAENCDGGGTTSTTEPEPPTTFVIPEGDVVAYCASETAASSLTLPENPTARQFKQYLLTEQDLVSEALANVPAEIAAEYALIASVIDELVAVADAASYEISDPAVLEVFQRLEGDPDLASADAAIDAFDTANCAEGDGGTGDPDGDVLALCAADETLNLLADDLFAATDPLDVEDAFIALITVLEQAVADAPEEVRGDVEVLLASFVALDESAASFGYDLSDPDLLLVLEALFEDPASTEASDNIDAWVTANCDTGVADDSAALDEIATLCTGGNLFACDVLYTTSDVGSELENLSLACGGDAMVSGGGGSCFDESPFLVEGDSPEMDAIADLCVAGNGQACYGLYINSVVDSDYETLGATCGFLQEETDDPFNCVTGDIGA